jgi:hypothetical protein
VSKWVWSYIVWGAGWLGLFLVAELLGEFRLAPWVTLSETVWHTDKTYPYVATTLFAVLLGLMAHFFYNRPLWTSILFGLVVSAMAHLFDHHLP